MALTDSGGAKLITYSAIAAFAMITWQEIKVKHEAPPPSRYVGAGLAFGLLDLASPVISLPLAGVFASGLAVAIAVAAATGKIGSGKEPAGKPQPSTAYKPGQGLGNA